MCNTENILDNEVQAAQPKLGIPRVGLGLDFSIENDLERAAAVDKLFQSKGPNWVPTQKEQEIITTYLLYGRTESGKSPIHDKDILSVSHTYNPKAPDSLERLMESPAFNESTIGRIDKKIQYKIPKPNLNRDEYREKSLPQELDQFTSLWNSIDEIDKLLREHKEGKRVIPLKKYYQLRHLLVDLRRQQYTLKDEFFPTLTQHIQPTVYKGGEVDESILGNWDTLEILPLGLHNKSNPLWSIEPSKLVNAVEFTPKEVELSLDFRNKDHIYQIVQFYEELETSAANDPESASTALLNTFNFYVELAELPPHQQEILQLKLLHHTNEEIRDIVNKKYNLSYSTPYISTIFTHQICEDIAQAAILHKDCYDKRNQITAWKICTGCGRHLLKDGRNFARYSRSRDGFQSKCKECDKKDRQERLKKKKSKEQ